MRQRRKSGDLNLKATKYLEGGGCGGWSQTSTRLSLRRLMFVKREVF